MQELWQDNGKLIDKREWGKLIDSLRSEEVIKNKKKAVEVLRKEIISAVKKRVPAGKFGIFFSGGVDSSLIAAICKLLKANFVCYAVMVYFR